MTPKEYYTAPPQHIFDDIKENAIKIWNTYEDPYKTEKLNRIINIENVSDNAWYMVAMFDYINIAKLLSRVESETADMIIDARRT